MAITTIQITDALIGTVVSPFPDGFVTKMTMTKSQQPAYQIEHHFALPLPYGTWRAGRFVLRDQGGAGRRVINVSTQHGALVSGHTLMTDGQAFAYSGDLVLEALPKGQEWELSISDVPVAVAVAA